MIQSAKNTKSSKTAKPDKTEEKINHVSIFPFRKQTCTVTQHTGDGEGWGRVGEGSRGDIFESEELSLIKSPPLPPQLPGPGRSYFDSTLRP